MNCLDHWRLFSLIQSELKWLNSLSLVIATIHKILCRNQVKLIVKFRRKTKFIRYEYPDPGERVQMDTCKIGPGLYQYTSVDDCTRYRVLRFYSRRTAANIPDFIDCVIEEMPFPIHRIQMDRGREFFAVKVREKLKMYGIKFRPKKPASPHFNGKVDRSQKTGKAEFYATVNLAATGIKIYW